MIAIPSALFLVIHGLSLMARDNSWWIVFVPATIWVLCGMRGASFVIAWAFIGCYSHLVPVAPEIFYALAIVPAALVWRGRFFRDHLDLGFFWGFPSLVVSVGLVAVAQFFVPTDLVLLSLGFLSIAVGAHARLSKLAGAAFALLFAVSAVISYRSPTGLLRFYERMAPDPWSWKQFYKDGPFSNERFEFYKSVNGHHYLGSRIAFMDDDSKRFAAFGMAPVKLLREYANLHGETGPVTFYGPLTKSICEKSESWSLDLVRTGELPELTDCPQARGDDRTAHQFIVALSPFDVRTVRTHLAVGGNQKRAALVCQPRYRARADKEKETPASHAIEAEIPGLQQELVEFRTISCILYSQGGMKKLEDLRSSPVIDRFLTVKGDL